MHCTSCDYKKSFRSKSKHKKRYAHVNGPPKYEKCIGFGCDSCNGKYHNFQTGRRWPNGPAMAKRAGDSQTGRRWPNGPTMAKWADNSHTGRRWPNRLTMAKWADNSQTGRDGKKFILSKLILFICFRIKVISQGSILHYMWLEW